MAIPSVPGNMPTIPQVGTGNQVARVNVQITSISISETGGVSGMERGHGAGRAFMQNVMQALNQAGLNVSQSVPAPGGSAGAAAAGNPNTAQAFHAFMHTLFDALRQAGTTQTGSGTDAGGPKASAIQSRYSNLPSNLESLIQSLGSGAPNSSTNPLQAAFDKLVAALKESDTSNSSTGSQTATLQSFLQHLLQNLQDQQSPASTPSGGVVSTSA